MIEQAKRVRPEKVSIVGEARTQLDGVEYLFVVGYGGLSVSKLETLRRELRGCQARLLVVKNTTMRRLAGENGWNGLDGILAGPNGIVAGRGDASHAAKIIKKFVADGANADVRGGVLAGQVLSAQDVEAIATLPAREQLYAMLACTLAAPMVQLAGVLQQKVASVVYVLKAVQDKKEQQ